MDDELKEQVVTRLSKWASGGTEFPQRVLMYPTNRCNLRCVFCYQQLKPYDFKDEMPKQKWIDLTKELCENGVSILQISGGGEPMLLPDTVLKMMQIIKKAEAGGRLVNNGTLWKENMVRQVIDLKWDNVIFSIDGENAKTHDFLRGVKGAFDKTVKAIEMFRDLKAEKNTELPTLEFSSVLTKLNYKQISGVIELANRIGIKVITFEPVFVSNPYVHEIKMSEKQRIEFMKKYIPPVIKLAEKYGMITNLHTLIDLKTLEKTGNLKEQILEAKKGEMQNKNSSSKSDSSNNSDKADKSAKPSNSAESAEKENSFFNLACFEPWLWPKIEANGEVGPCSTNMLKNENIKNKTFKEVWFGKAFKDFRKKIMKGDLPDGCENCVSTHLPLNNKIRKYLIEHHQQEHQQQQHNQHQDQHKHQHNQHPDKKVKKIDKKDG